MGKLVYLMNVSLDGFVETPEHGLDWTVVDDELHGWFNDRIREAGAFVYGRRLYEVMSAYWPTAEADPAATPVMLEFARIWNPKPKVVFSSTLSTVNWNSRLASGDVGPELERMRREIDGELQVAGPTLAAQFIKRDLVDEYRLVVHPVTIGAGTPYFPPLDRPLALELFDTRRFASGAVYLGYRRTRRQAGAGRLTSP
jgi:dihydrofolate reductase